MYSKTILSTRQQQAGVGALIACAFFATACGTDTKDLPSRADGITDVVASTQIVADIARNVAGNRARVTALMPRGADPHTYEPSLRDVRNVANADVIFTNGLLLEQQSVLRAIDNAAVKPAKVVALGEQSTKRGAHLLQLVEDVTLDSVWLGMRVEGTGTQLGANSHSEINIHVTGVHGADGAEAPGDAAAYLTTAFGTPEVYFNSRDGFHPERGYEGDTITLPAAAHTHVSWAFSKPGVYVIDIEAELVTERGARPIPVGASSITMAVGVSAKSAPSGASATVLEQGHQDVSINLNNKKIEIQGDAADGKDIATVYDAASTVIEVPNNTLQKIPAGPQFRFLGTPGDEVYVLPQAVLGKHVHGEVDPHLWHDVDNVIAFVKTIRDELIAADPQGAREYTTNADAYIGELGRLHQEVTDTIASIPEERRHLVTTHDGYSYLAHAYGIDVAGFVTPNPGVEPSARDLIALTNTLKNLHVPAVFLEPQLAVASTDLLETAKRLNIRVCPIRGDSFDEDVTTYIDLMRANATSLQQCLGVRRDTS